MRYVRLTLKDSLIVSLDCGTHRALISEKYTNLNESAKLIRREEVLLHQLRVGECRSEEIAGQTVGLALCTDSRLDGGKRWEKMPGGVDSWTDGKMGEDACWSW